MKKGFIVNILIFTFLMTFFTPFSVKTEAGFYDIFSIENVDDGVRIIGCDKNVKGKIVVPSEIYFNPVVEIGGSAFRDCKGITEVVIPNSVKRIAMWVFMDCTSLTKVTLPDSLTEIDAANFVNTPIESNPDNWENNAFYVDSYLIKTRDNIPSQFTVREGTRLIAAQAFKNNKNLSKVTLPNSLVSISREAFYGCSSLSEVTIPESIKSIGYCAFQECANLYNITLPDGLEEIGRDAFSATALYRAQEKWDNGVLYIGKHFIDIKSGYSGDCEIRPGTKSISDSAFAGKTFIKKVVVPDSLKVISDGCFYQCGLTDISLPFGLEKIRIYAFGECRNLTTIKLPETLRCIESSAFNGCYNLRSINIPTYIDELKSSIFHGCQNLESLTLSRNLSYIEEGTFSSHENLRHVYFDGFPEEKRYIIIEPSNDFLEYAVWHFADIKYNLNDKTREASVFAVYKEKEGTLIIPENFRGYTVNKIEGEAVNDCKKLSGIKIPKTIKNIADGAFAGSSKLKNITIAPENPDYKAESGVIYNKQGTIIKSYPSPEEKTEISDVVTEVAPYAFKNCAGLKELTLTFSLNKVGKGAFLGCSNLNLIKYDGFETDREKIIIDTENEPLLNAKWDFVFYKFAIRDNKAILLGCRTDASDIAEVPKMYKGNPVTEIADNAFKDCKDVTEVIFPESVTKIGINTFENCVNLAKFTFPKNITKISDGMFKNCQKFEIFDVPQEIESIGNSAFMGCTNLMILKLPYTVTSVGNSAFANCNNLSMVIYSGIDSEKENIMVGTSNDYFINATWKMPDIRHEKNNNEVTILKVSNKLQGVYEVPQVLDSLPVTKIGNEAFKDCTLITEVKIPSTVKMIGANAFNNCTGLIEIDVPEGVETIENNSFSGCRNVKFITLPKSVNKIGENAFLNVNVSRIYYRGTKADKDNINININNDVLNNARWMFETLPLKASISSSAYENNNLSVNLNLENMVDNSLVFGALYVDKVLVGVNKSVANKDLTNLNILIPATINKNSNYTLKIMVWDNNLNPLTFVNEKTGTI